MYTSVPPHAAVGETVALAGSRERPFVNAVLRRLASAPSTVVGGQDERAVSRRTGLAEWAVRELRRLLPADEVEPAAEGFARRAPLSIRTVRCAAGVDELESLLRDSGAAVTRGSVDADCLLVDRGDPSRLPGFEEGWFAVQDQSSAFVVRTLAAVRGERVLDVCAAPGGKALAVACDVSPDGRVVAADIRPRRLALAVPEARRQRVRVQLVAQDARAPAVAGSFDRVLVDAPCSGLGAARRRPELLWRIGADELSSLARRQVAIVASAADLLRPGGRLVYSVCTFPRAETDAACDAIVRHRPELEAIPTPGPDGLSLRHRLWPHRHDTDGMFVAAFERRS
jgi:16S rRNA (cytosine967-C5)-methyltransferase